MPSRKWLTENFESMVDAAVAKRNDPSVEIYHPEEPEGFEEWPKAYILAQEREALGFYVTGHPLDGLESLVKQNSSTSAEAIQRDETLEGSWTKIAGVLTFVEKKRSKSGNNWASCMLEDFTGSIECMFFSKVYETVGHMLTEDSVVFLKGRVSEGRLMATELSIPKLRELT